LRAGETDRYGVKVPPRFGAKRRPRNPEPETAASLLPAVVARLGGDDRGTEQRVSMAWADAVGEMLNRRARPESLRGRTLYVRVESSALAHELTLLKGAVIERLRVALGASLVDDLRTRVGSIKPDS
jgi:predicted nucleic acid-binding Zn ribbon protein